MEFGVYRVHSTTRCHSYRSREEFGCTVDERTLAEARGMCRVSPWWWVGVVEDAPLISP